MRGWEAIACFESFDAGVEFCSALTQAPGIVKKEVCFFSEAVARFITQFEPHLPAGQHAALLAVAESSEGGVLDMVEAFGSRITYRKTAEEVAKSNRTLLEATWNHTTLHALKIDKTITCIQTSFEPARHVEQVKTMERLLGGEVLMHLEFLRTKEGEAHCSGLPLVRYSNEARLNEIMQIHRDHGVMINNPHVYVVEDGKQARLNPGVVESKARFDPQGLLNPGKLRACSLREGAGSPPTG